MFAAYFAWFGWLLHDPPKKRTTATTLCIWYAVRIHSNHLKTTAKPTDFSLIVSIFSLSNLAIVLAATRHSSLFIALFTAQSI